MSTYLKKLMEQVKPKIKEISHDTLKEQLDSNEDLVIIDVRPEKDWNNGHIPGAIHCERGTLEVQIENIIPNINRRIITCCKSGICSALCAESLQRMGYTNVESLAEGFNGWCKNNLPTE